MTNQRTPITWAALLGLLPHDLSKLAKSTGAASRWRKVCGGEQFLWLCLVYAQALVSMRTMAGFSVGLGADGLKEASVLYRLRKAGPFLAAILLHVLGATIASRKSKGVCRNVRLQDATTLSVAGSTGTDWRLHVVCIPGQGFTNVEITDSKGAESLKRGEYSPGDIVVADQGLGRANDLHHVHSVGADFLVRVCLSNLKLNIDDQRTRLPIQSVLDRADHGDVCTTVWLPKSKSVAIKARLIAQPLPADKSEVAREKLRKRASRKQRKLSELALRLAGYVVVLTSLGQDFASDQQILEIYRIRWQIELLFKRWKSILNLDKLEAQDPALVRTFCLGKLIEAAVIERLNEQALELYAASPFDALDNENRPPCSCWRLTVLHREHFRASVFSAYPIPDSAWPSVVHAMREGKRKRLYASATITAIHAKLNAAPQRDEAA